MKEQPNGIKNIPNLVDSSNFMDRRQFLADSANAFAGAVVASFFSTGITRTLSLEGNEGDGLNSGILALRKEVMENQNEVGMDYCIDQQGKGSWHNKWEGEADHLNQGMNEINFILISMKEGYTEVHSYHTHELEEARKLDLISDKKLEAARRGEQTPMPSIPPSAVDQKGMGDLGQALYLRVWFKNRIETKCMAVDARGVWSYIPDESHPFVKKYMDNFSLLIKAFLTLRGNPITRSIIDMLPQEKKEDLPSFISYLDSDNSFLTQVDSKTAFMIRNASEKWKEFFIEFKKQRDILYKTIGKFEKNSCDSDSPSLVNLLEAYKNLGFTVNFTLFEDLK